MATKTISIDLEAYRRLTGARSKTESFSDVIKRRIQPPVNLKSWFRLVEVLGKDERFARAVEQHVAGRLNRSRTK